MAAMTVRCPNCDGEATTVREMREVLLGQRQVVIEDESMRCATCGEDFYSRAQADRRHRLSIERARLDDNLLLPSQIKDVRESLGLTQAQFEDILGVGEKTCVRWETGRVCQNIATDRLIRLIAADPENVRRLAAINGVAIPEAVTIRQGEAVR
jgi:HTH-type transcriptional regulator / antitoxin MqsA